MEARPSYTYEQLLEKIIRAKVKLESCRKQHNDSCPVEYDPEGYAPCKCGASAVNSAIFSALNELKL